MGKEIIYKYNIGENIIDENRNLVISERIIKYRESFSKRDNKIATKREKHYKYTCNVCGWTEGWSYEGNLSKGAGCSCCYNRTAVLGINTIWDTHKWLVDDFGLDEEFAKTHTHGTSEKAMFICNDCGKARRVQVYSVIRLKSIGCICGDGFSYPEKFMHNMIKQLRCDFEYQYSPSYLEGRCSDFYLPAYNLIIETDGLLGHDGGRSHSKSENTLEYEVLIDKWKDEQHKLHGIETIRINCFKSDAEYIKNNILDSNLSELLDLSNVDWSECDKFALSNIVKEVCEYWNHKDEMETTSDVGAVFNIHYSTASRFLKKGAEFGWCSYDAREEMKKNGSRGGKLFMKRVKMYKGEKVMGVFESAAELERQSESIFGVKLNFGSISSVCRGCTHQYKGYRFEYITEEEYLNSQSLKKVV